MPEPFETWTVEVQADTRPLEQQLSQAAGAGRQFGRQLTSAFEGVALQGKGLGDVLRSLALGLSRLTLQAAFRPLEQGLGSLITSLIAPAAVTPFAKGGVVQGGLPIPFAQLDDLHAVIAFFEERRGRLYGFRWRDHTDCKSCAPQSEPGPLDQSIGVGDGATAVFGLAKTYGSAFAPWRRRISKPVAGSVVIAVDGVAIPVDEFTADTATGAVTFAPAQVPAPGANVTAGFAFDVPVRFDTDRLEINLAGFRHGAIPNVPVIEVRV